MPTDPNALLSASNSKHARYGPSDRYFSPPGAGMCISVFAVVRASGGKILVGKPKFSDRWFKEWLPNALAYSKEEFLEYSDVTQLPCSYLFEGEHPDDTLRRVMRDQLGIAKYKAGAPTIVSYFAASRDWYPGQGHWDLAFVYDVRAALAKKSSPLWRELDWKETSKMRAAEFGWNADFVKDLGIVRR